MERRLFTGKRETYSLGAAAQLLDFSSRGNIDDVNERAL